MVNRIIPYLGYMPHVLHRLDMYTSGKFMSTPALGTSVAE